MAHQIILTRWPVCLGDEFTKPKGGTLCCTGGTVMAVDESTRDAACCAPGKVFTGGACADPTPQITCPAYNGKFVQK